MVEGRLVREQNFSPTFMFLHELFALPEIIHKSTQGGRVKASGHSNLHSERRATKDLLLCDDTGKAYRRYSETSPFHFYFVQFLQTDITYRKDSMA